MLKGTYYANLSGFFRDIQAIKKGLQVALTAPIKLDFLQYS